MSPKTIATHERRARFLVDFACRDLDECDERGWERLRRELRDYLGFGRGSRSEALTASGSAHALDQIEAATEKRLRALQESIRRMLDELYHPTKGAPAGTGLLALEGLWGVTLTRWRGWTTIGVVGDAEAEIVLLAVLALASLDTSDVLKCPECGRVFIRKRRQKFCSARCRNRAGYQAWLSDPANYERKLELDRQRQAAKGRKK